MYKCFVIHVIICNILSTTVFLQLKMIFPIYEQILVQYSYYHFCCLSVHMALHYHHLTTKKLSYIMLHVCPSHLAKVCCKNLPTNNCCFFFFRLHQKLTDLQLVKDQCTILEQENQQLSNDIANMRTEVLFSCT